MALLTIKDFEAQAKLKLAPSIYDYIAGGSGDEYTLQRNIDQFSRIQIIPRILRGSHHFQTSITLLNHQLSMPLFVAPTAFHCTVDPLGEIATVKAVNDVGVGMVLSTMSTVALEDVANIATCPLWFQLYVYKDRAITQQLINRAELSGYEGLVLTADVPIMAKRGKDIRNQFKLPKGLVAKNFLNTPMADLTRHSVGSDVKNYTDALFDPSLTWDDIEWIRAQTKLPLILKGVMHEQDAFRALDLKIDAIIISNHGGRQLDSVPATIEVLPGIAKIINGKIPILIDGGFRRGADIFKAIALGADCIMLGRSVLWALAVNGTEGVKNMFDLYFNELKETMILCGCQTIDDIKNIGSVLFK